MCPMNLAGENWWITEADEPDESLRARKMIERFALEAFRGVEPEAEYIDRLSLVSLPFVARLVTLLILRSDCH